MVGIFTGSVYRLFQEGQDFRPEALTPMAANPISEGRAPASLAPTAFQSLDVGCEGATPAADTGARKIRLNGRLCGAAEGRPLRAEVVNQANRYSATVFTDLAAGRFSTDYIPLVAGSNTIHLQFSDGTGTAFTRELVVNQTTALPLGPQPSEVVKQGS